MKPLISKTELENHGPKKHLLKASKNNPRNFSKGLVGPHASQLGGLVHPRPPSYWGHPPNPHKKGDRQTLVQDSCKEYNTYQTISLLIFFFFLFCPIGIMAPILPQESPLGCISYLIKIIKIKFHINTLLVHNVTLYLISLKNSKYSKCFQKHKIKITKYTTTLKCTPSLVSSLLFPLSLKQ